MEIQKSESIIKLVNALVVFQNQVTAVKKDAKNPFFHSSYASLDNIIETIRGSLAANGMTLMQFPTTDCGLLSILAHISGEYIAVEMKMVPKDDSPQGQGSAITYMRRYSMAAILGLANDEDDDGNAASKPTSPAAKPYPRQWSNHPAQVTPITQEAMQTVEEAFGQPFPDSPVQTAPIATCPVHQKPMRHNTRGWYCSTKVGDGWCKEKPAK